MTSSSKNSSSGRQRLGLFVKSMSEGKSIMRSLQNVESAGYYLSGSGIDLGAKDGSASYYRYIRSSPDCTIEFSDIEPAGPEVIHMDLNKGIPEADESRDFLLLMNVLEHLYDYRTVAAECRRVLKPGGILVGSVPFLFNVHPDPSDFFRFTGEGLERIFKDGGFSDAEIVPLGTGPFLASVQMWSSFLKFWPLKCGVAFCAMGLDRLLGVFVSSSLPDRFPLGYFFKAVK